MNLQFIGLIALFMGQTLDLNKKKPKNPTTLNADANTHYPNGALEYNINKPNQNKRNTDQPNHKSNKPKKKKKTTRTLNDDHNEDITPV